MLPILLVLASCGYLKSAAKQGQYSRTHRTNPSQRNLKHMLDRETFFVYGLIKDPGSRVSSMPLAVAAFSSRYEPDELVDVTHFAGADTHYALNLPAGEYELVVLADRDGDGTLGKADAVGRRSVSLSETAFEDKVLTDFDITVNETARVGWPIAITPPATGEVRQSLFYPQGTLRSLDDPIFDPEMATLGLYEPAAFLEIAPTMFYALEEYLHYKVPVIFVHGIGGTVHDFEPIIARLDRDRYVPWFFYYPSGASLGQLAENFHALFLSGRLFPRTDMPMVVVAHSMGGVIAREAMNLVGEQEIENQVASLITIASPLGGHPSAAMTGGAPLVLPSWRDLDPEGPFIGRLYRRPLPAYLDHRLLFAYGEPGMIKLGEAGDGVVPLSSQLHPSAQEQATAQFGVDASHTGVLQHEHAIGRIIAAIGEVKSIVPESHLQVLLTGGFDRELDDSYSARQKYSIRYVGRYLQALASGRLEPVEADQAHFVLVSRGLAAPVSFVEEAWLKLVADHPEILAPAPASQLP